MILLEDNIYYVYEWIRLDTNEPFYVGMGHKNRWRDFQSRNKWFINIVRNVKLIYFSIYCLLMGLFVLIFM